MQGSVTKLHVGNVPMTLQTQTSRLSLPISPWKWMQWTIMSRYLPRRMSMSRRWQRWSFERFAQKKIKTQIEPSWRESRPKAPLESLRRSISKSLASSTKSRESLFGKAYDVMIQNDETSDDWWMMMPLGISWGNLIALMWLLLRPTTRQRLSASFAERLSHVRTRFALKWSRSINPFSSHDTVWFILSFLPVIHQWYSEQKIESECRWSIITTTILSSHMARRPSYPLDQDLLAKLRSEIPNCASALKTKDNPMDNIPPFLPSFFSV